MALRDIVARFRVQIDDRKLKSVDKLLKRSEKDAKRLERATKFRSTGFGRLRTSLVGLNKNLNTTIKGAKSFGVGLAKAVAPAAAALTAAAAAAGFLAKSVVSSGADFEQAITAVGAVGLQTRDQIQDLEKEALRLGSTTKFTATEAANAMELMAKAGFTNQQILQGVGGVLNAAAASGLELAEVADHVSNVLKGMGLETSEATRVADVLALASARTNSSIGSLGESMKNVSPVARQLGISLEDAVSMVALLQDVGLDASEAGSSVATALTKLSKPTPGVAKDMKRLGIAFQDVHGNALPVPKLLEQFAAAADKSGGNMEQLAFFADLVGLRGQKAVLNLQQAFRTGRFAELTKELQGAAGVAEKMAGLRMQNLIGDFELFKSALEGLKIELYGVEGGPLRDIVQAMTKWLGDNKTDIVAWVSKAVGGLKTFAGYVKEGLLPFIEGFREVFGEMFSDSDPESAKQWGAVLKELGKNIGVLIGLAAMFAAAFIATYTAVAVAVNTLASAVMGAWNGLIAFFGEKYLQFETWWQDISDLWGAEGSSLAEKSITIGARIVEAFIQGLKSVVVDGVIGGIFGGAWNAAKNALGVGDGEAPEDPEVAAGRKALGSRFAFSDGKTAAERDAESEARTLQESRGVLAPEPSNWVQSAGNPGLFNSEQLSQLATAFGGLSQRQAGSMSEAGLKRNVMGIDPAVLESAAESWSVGSQALTEALGAIQPQLEAARNTANLPAEAAVPPVNNTTLQYNDNSQFHSTVTAAPDAGAVVGAVRGEASKARAVRKENAGRVLTQLGGSAAR